MDIIFESTTRTFYLNTKNSTYAFFINELGVSEHLYYGKRIPQQDLRGICFRQTYSFAPYDSVVGDRVSPDTFLQEAPSGNAGDSRICALSVYGSALITAFPAPHPDNAISASAAHIIPALFSTVILLRTLGV